MAERLIITGAKRFQGTIEGKTFDSTTLYVQANIDTSNGDGAGFAVLDYKWGDSKNFLKIASLNFPFSADVTFETVTTGKSRKTILTNVEPVPAAPASPVPPKVG